MQCKDKKKKQKKLGQTNVSVFLRNAIRKKKCIDEWLQHYLLMNTKLVLFITIGSKELE